MTSSAAGRLPVIPGRAESANPESRNGYRACIWIPGPALSGRPGMTTWPYVFFRQLRANHSIAFQAMPTLKPIA